MRFPTHYPIAEIWWEDAAALDAGWLSKEESTKQESVNTIVHSVGFIVQETDEHLIYCSDVDHEGETNGRSKIPKAMIRKIKYLGGPRKKTTRTSVAKATATPQRLETVPKHTQSTP